MSNQVKPPKKEQKLEHKPKLKLKVPYVNLLILLGILVIAIGWQLTIDKKNLVENPSMGKGVPKGPPGKMSGPFVIVAGVAVLGLGIAFERARKG